MNRQRILIFALCVIALTLVLTFCTAERNPEDELTVAKPVIYLYPTEKTDVTVKLDYSGDLFVTYPAYQDGWSVTAYPDGTLVNQTDGAEYSYLFWEGRDDVTYDFSTGFVVRGEDTESFLREKLSLLGLLPKEYNEFIVYWLPRMIENPYNLISFQQDVYTDTAPLEISPAPDSIQRVFMAFQPLAKAIEMEPQVLQPFQREDFTVVEWGGCEAPA